MSTGSGCICLYRAVGALELADILQQGFRPGPPSYQGKWFAEAVADAQAWGRQLYQQRAFHVVEVVLPVAVAVQLFRLPHLDGIGPARFADIPQLPLLNSSHLGIREVP